MHHGTCAAGDELHPPVYIPLLAFSLSHHVSLSFRFLFLSLFLSLELSICAL
jgi:hypothetical protein